MHFTKQSVLWSVPLILHSRNVSSLKFSVNQSRNDVIRFRLSEVIYLNLSNLAKLNSALGYRFVAAFENSFSAFLIWVLDPDRANFSANNVWACQCGSPNVKLFASFQKFVSIRFKYLFAGDVESCSRYAALNEPSSWPIKLERLVLESYCV